MVLVVIRLLVAILEYNNSMMELLDVVEFMLSCMHLS